MCVCGTSRVDCDAVKRCPVCVQLKPAPIQVASAEGTTQHEGVDVCSVMRVSATSGGGRQQRGDH